MKVISTKEVKEARGWGIWWVTCVTVELSWMIVWLGLEETRVSKC